MDLITPILDSNGIITNFISVSEDITQRKQEEIEKEKTRKQLIESEKLSAIGQLATGIAHEFNNVLATIKSSVQLILLKHKLKQVTMSEELVTELISIESNIKRGSDIVSNLMTLSKPVELKQDFYQIQDVIEEVLKIQKKTDGN